MYVTPASAPFLGPNWLFSFYSALFDCNHIHLLFYVDVFSGRFKTGCRAYKAILSVLKVSSEGKNVHCPISCLRSPGGTSHMKGVGMLVGNFELNP